MIEVNDQRYSRNFTVHHLSDFTIRYNVAFLRYRLEEPKGGGNDNVVASVVLVHVTQLSLSVLDWSSHDTDR